MATYIIEALDSLGDVAATASIEATSSGPIGAITTLFPDLPEGNYTFRAYTPESGMYAVVVAGPDPVPGATVQLLLVKGASNEVGGANDDPTATRTAEDFDPNVYFLNLSASSTPTVVQPAFDDPIPRIGGAVSISTTPAINAAKVINSINGGDTITVIAQIAFGGQGPFAGVPGSDLGPMHPDGAGPAWDFGGSSADGNVPGSLYLFDTASSTVNTIMGAIAAEFPGRTILPPIAMGKIANENDIDPSNFAEQLEVSQRYIADLRTAWNTPDMPFLISSAPPPFSFSSALASPEVPAMLATLAQTIPYAAYTEGPGEAADQHGLGSGEEIHFGNPGLRKQGTRLGSLLPLARSRSTAPMQWMDWIDGMTNRPAHFYSFYRGLSTYTGPCIRVSNGVSEVDIGFTAERILDVVSLQAHAAAGTGNAWITVFYDHMGGVGMVPEGTGQALIVVNNDLLFQGRRIAWGNDSNNILLRAPITGHDAGSALLAVGRIADSGNAVQADLDNRTLTLFAQAGVTKYNISSNPFELDTPQEFEPPFITSLPQGGSGRGYNLHANYVDSTGMRSNGVLLPATASTGTSTGAAGVLGWGGRPTAVNRYGNGSHVGLGTWIVAPVGADLDIVNTWCASIGAVDDRAFL